MRKFFLVHRLKNSGCLRVTCFQPFDKIQVNTAILFLERYCQGKDLPLIQICELFAHFRKMLAQNLNLSPALSVRLLNHSPTLQPAEKFGYLRYLLMTSISSSAAAALSGLFSESAWKRCRRTCPSRISAIRAFMAPRQAARVRSISPHSRSSLRAFSMPLICPRMRLILARSFF